MSYNKQVNRTAFTLIELLIVVGILAILAAVVLLSLNPIELINQARDSTRAAELKSLDKAIAFAVAQNSNIYLGSSSVIYTSLPDTSPTCYTYTTITPVLPILPAGWSYSCAPQANFRTVSGAGWVPVDLGSLAIQPLETLPVDSINNPDKGLYYTYITNSSRQTWKFSSDMNSKSFSNSGTKDIESRDGGPNYFLFEAGSDLSLSPFAEQKVPTTCVQLGSGVNGPGSEFYSKWKIPGTGKVTVTKLWYWQKNYSGSDDLLGLGEKIEVAIYAGNDTSYIKVGTAIMNGNGTDPNGVEGWLSGDLDSAAEITLGQNYVFGIGRIGSPLYIVPRDFNQACNNYLPRTPSYSNIVSGGLDSNVTVFSNHTAFPDIGDPGYPSAAGSHIGIFGISYVIR